MIVRTSNDATAINCGCCDMPACEEPRKQCESITATVTSAGLFKSEDTAWKIYLTRSEVTTISQSSDEPFTTYASSANETHGETYDRNFSGMIGPGGESCTTWSATSEEFCGSSGSSALTFYGSDPEDSEARGEVNTRIVTTRSDISGTESQAHMDWVAAHPDFAAEMAAWEIAHDAWHDAYIAWLISDPETRGDPPEEPPRPEAEPDENYPPCTYKDTQVTTDYSVEPAEVTTVEFFGGLITTIYSYVGGGVTYEVIYSDGKTYDEWVSETATAVNTAMTWPADDCKDDPGACSSKLTVTPEPEDTGTTLSLVATKARYKIGIPDGYSRSVFECQWDEVFFPTEWDAWKALKDAFDLATAAHDVWTACRAGATPDACGDEPEIPADPGEAPTPAPSLIASRSWSYDGTEELSEWFEVEVPETSGETRIVNMLVKCFRSSRLGVKPTSSGEVYVFPA